MRNCTIIQDVADLAKIEGLWRELYEQSASTTLFQSFPINRNVAAVFAKRERPYVVAVDGDEGAAIIPACISGNSLKFIGEELFDYPNVLASSEEALQQAWQALDGLGLPLHLHGVREVVKWGDVTPFVGAPYRPQQDRLPPRDRLEKNFSALVDLGCRLDRLESGAELLAIVRRIYMLKGQHRSGALFQDPLRIDGVVALCAAEDAHAELHVLRKNNDIVAATLAFIDHTTCRFYGTYFDDRWAALSPGVSLLYQVVRDAQARGLDFDFMTGEQPYKMRLATGVQPLFRLARIPAAHEATAA